MLLKYNEKNELKNRLLEINKVLEKNIIDSENKYYCSFKIGVYLFSENDKSIQIAIDKANYAKDQVRELTNENIIFYEEKFRQYFINEKELELMMEKALVEKEFEVYYQPNYELKDNQIINAEALVRWNNPKKGLLYPNEFLPLFCKNGFIKKIDYYVYETVCSNISNWIKQGKKLCPISCNFSKQTILSHNFISQLTSIADKYQVPYSFLEIEISESSTDNVINILAAIINRLKSLGFYITIDNFGVGYSSLSIIQKLNIDIIKLDRRFFDVKKNTSLEKDLLEMLIKVSRKNKIKFICKGVETAENENFLKQIKCIYVQGFKYSKALKEADFEKLL